MKIYQQPKCEMQMGMFSSEFKQICNSFKIGVLITPILLLQGCATNSANELQTVVDPSYNFIVDNNNKISQDSYINFKISSVKNGVINGYLIENLFNINSNVILFKSGDKLSINYTNLGATCSYNNAILFNYKNEDTQLNGFMLTNNDMPFNCNTKSATIGLRESDIYTIKVLTSNSLPILNGCSVPDLFSSKVDSTYSLYKVVTSRNNLSWIPVKIFDNGIQTYIKLKSVPNGKNSKFIVYNNLGGYKAYPINYSYKDDGIVVDGVYNNISLIYLSENESNIDKGEISILRNNVPNSNNLLVNKLYQMKDGFYKQDSINQQGAVVGSVYQQQQNSQTPASTFNQQNSQKYSEDMIIAKANTIPLNQQNPQNKAFSSQASAQTTNSVITSQNGIVPPLSNSQNKNGTTQIYPIETSTQSTQDQSDVNINNQTSTQNGFGMSIMKQLNFN